MAHRWLGQDNDFTLGSIGQPSLAMLADYALKMLNLWYWFGAFISFTYISELDEFDNEMLGHYHHTAKQAQEVAKWLGEQFNRLLAKEQAEMEAQSAHSLSR